MKATGIVRRIDDLGRIVIPKEIRRSLRIEPGNPLELFLNGSDIVFKKYQPMGAFEWEKLYQAIKVVCGSPFAIYDHYKDLVKADIEFAHNSKTLADLPADTPIVWTTTDNGTEITVAVQGTVSETLQEQIIKLIQLLTVE